MDANVQPLPFDVIVYFGSPSHSLYQLSSWLGPLSDLAEHQSLGLVVRDWRLYKALSHITDLPVVFVDSYRDLSSIVDRSDIKVALYVNHASSNYQMLRFAEMLHVHIGHGESNKAYMAANQIKAYDFVFVAGAAAEERLVTRLYRFDKAKVIHIGRPQIRGSNRIKSTIPTVLYAPTYEGDITGSSYTSLPLFGEQLVRLLIESDRFRVIYRPHPLTGVHETEVANADRAIRRLVSSTGHLVDTESPLSELMDGADFLVGDKSSVVVDWLAHDRPFLVTDTSGETTSPFFEAGGVLTSATVTDVVSLIAQALEQDSASEARKDLARRHLGPGYDEHVGASRFISAVQWVVEERDAWTKERSDPRRND